MAQFDQWERAELQEYIDKLVAEAQHIGDHVQAARQALAKKP